MTEVPEHLLRRSRERREALGLSKSGASPTDAAPTEGESGSSTAVEPAAQPPAAQRPAVPAPPPVPVAPAPKPDPPHVVAAKQRKKIPWWAMPVLAALPVWAGLYAFTLEPPPTNELDPLAMGEQLFDANCASCHGASGEGGAGPAFRDGAVTETWPAFRDHLHWVMLGDEGWPFDAYGAQRKPRTSGMPAFESQLTPQELVLVVRYEREELGGEAPEEELVTLSETAAEGGDVEQEIGEPTPQTPEGS